ncbi:DUF6082 family protein [Lipingzhangella sp. LS1_29]|uniref:DUF6082 family protein n=1 Tax=Lipingzhangella rawalii TaxID=2055835 RepID=A0ABU2H648_9ACTN|nr:DUF6082 family protein [Lipingzhangella rawalii]MDS1270756.1 DUF6082 family protein [Lipingzhangella rawalii]
MRRRLAHDHGWSYFPVLVVLLTVLVVAVVGVSPFGLSWFTELPQDWQELSLVGQTYGAASAVLAGLALLGIVATLVLQVREMRNTREVALRQSNSELLRMAMDHPEYLECWGTNFPADAGRADRQRMYTNLIVSQWEMAYESGAMGDAMLRAVARKVLAGPIGWEYWRDVRDIRLDTAETRRAKRFHRLLDKEFHQLPDPREHPAQRRDAPVAPKRTGRWILTGGALGAGLAVAVVGWRFRRKLLGI